MTDLSDLEQGSDAWLLARCGKVTASRVAHIVAKTKSGVAASRVNYLAELVAERLTGRPAERFSNAAMQWGTTTEPDARAAYSFYTGADVKTVGLVQHPGIPMSAASPDGLVGDDGLVEIKCPNTATHIETLLGGAVPGNYRTQIQWQLACTGRQWCDFVSFDPRLPEHLRLFIRRIERDDTTIRDLDREVRIFLADLNATIAALQSKYPHPQSEAAE